MTLTALPTRPPSTVVASRTADVANLQVYGSSKPDVGALGPTTRVVA